jgi:hypothetical protein
MTHPLYRMATARTPIRCVDAATTQYRIASISPATRFFTAVESHETNKISPKGGNADFLKPENREKIYGFGKNFSR